MPVHHPRLIRELGARERVLEIGPGAFPFPRADVLCDRYARDDPHAIHQDGNVARPRYGKPVLIYEGKLPFADGAFDYVVCSHVLEHVPVGEEDAFVSELARVAREGYLEVPSYLLEVTNDVSVHRWLVHVAADGEIRMLPKERVADLVAGASAALRPIFESLTGVSPGYQQLYRDYVDLWVVGIPWRGRPRLRRVETLEQLLEGGGVERSIAPLADRERAERPLARQIGRALARRARALLPRARGAEGPTLDGASDVAFPEWVGAITVCPSCGTAGLDFQAAAAHCRRCRARFPSAAGEFHLVADRAAAAPARA